MSTFLPNPYFSRPLLDSKETVKFVAEYWKVPEEVAEELCRSTPPNARQAKLDALKQMNASLPAGELSAFEALQSKYRE